MSTIFDEFNNDTFGNITDGNSTIFNDTIDGNITGNNTIPAVDVPLDPWLLAIVIIFPVIIVFFSFIVLVNMQHPDDRSAAYFPKFVVVVGLSLAQITVLMFPLDVANQSGQLGCGTWNTLCGGLDMGLAWKVVFMSIVAMVVVIIPFSIFFYEAYIPGKNVMTQFCEAMQYQIGVIIIAVIAFVLMSRYLSTAYIPINTIKIDDSYFTTCALNPLRTTPIADTVLAGSACNPQTGLIYANVSVNHTFDESVWTDFVNVQSGRGDTLVMSVSTIVFLTCFFSFIGWFAFSLFVGVGLIVTPIEFIRDFKYRPQYMPKSAYLYVREDIQKRVNDAISVLSTIKGERKTMYSKKWSERRRISTKSRQAIKKIKAEIVSLENEYEELVLCHEQWKSYNPLIPFGKLLMGLIGGIISILWLIHIVLYMFIRFPFPNGYPLSYFLNDMLTWGMKEINFALLGVLFLGIFAFHLLLCVIKGNFKIGVRFFIFEVHPMKYHGTYMNSFLVNTSLILLTTPALVMFCSQAFADFVVLTEIQVIGAQVTYMEFFRYFFQYNAFVALILFLSFITFVYLMTFPNDKQAQAAKKLKATIAKFEGLEDEHNKKAVEERKKERKAGATFSSSIMGNGSKSTGGAKTTSTKDKQFDVALV